MREIFISWSKDRSRRLAEALFNLIRDEVGKDNVVWSPDLPKGGTWFESLAGYLEEARAGIICITPENHDSPWLLFEAGALIRCDYRVALFPVLLDVSPAAIEGPLSLVQSTVIERDPASIRLEIGDLLTRVVDHVNQYGLGLNRPQPPPAGQVPPADSAWQAFTTGVLKIEPPSVASLVPGFSDLFRRKTFQEPFVECMDQRWRERYAAARLTYAELVAAKPVVDTALPSGARTAYGRLCSAVDGYAMAIAGLLLKEREYPRDKEGRLEDSHGELAICERRRQQIDLAFCRLDDPTPPIFDEAYSYEELSSLEERKRRLIHPLERKLEQALAEGAAEPDPLDLWQRQRASTSPWLYDRIVSYLRYAHDPRQEAFSALAGGIEFEISRLESLDEPDTMVGLYYALEAVETQSQHGSGGDLDPALLDRVDANIERWNARARRIVEGPEEPDGDRWDANRKVRRIVARIRGSAVRVERPARRKKKTSQKRTSKKKATR